MSKLPDTHAVIFRAPYSEMNGETALLLRDPPPPFHHSTAPPTLHTKTRTTTPPEARAQAQAQTHLLLPLHHTQTR